MQDLPVLRTRLRPNGTSPSRCGAIAFVALIFLAGACETVTGDDALNPTTTISADAPTTAAPTTSATPSTTESTATTAPTTTTEATTTTAPTPTTEPTTSVPPTTEPPSTTEPPPTTAPATSESPPPTDGSGASGPNEPGELPYTGPSEAAVYAIIGLSLLVGGRLALDGVNYLRRVRPTGHDMPPR